MSPSPENSVSTATKKAFSKASNKESHPILAPPLVTGITCGNCISRHNGKATLTVFDHGGYFWSRSNNKIAARVAFPNDCGTLLVI